MDGFGLCINLQKALSVKHDHCKPNHVYSELAAAETNWTSAAIFSCCQGDGDLSGQERHSPEPEILQQLLQR